MDDLKPHAELVVMLVIGLKAANYIKLVSQGYVSIQLASQEYVMSDERVDCYAFREALRF
jgi:hypothetical protein